MRWYPALPFRLVKTKVVVNRPKNWQICGFIIVLGHHHPLSLRNSRQRCPEKRRFWSRQTTKLQTARQKYFRKNTKCAYRRYSSPSSVIRTETTVAGWKIPSSGAAHWFPTRYFKCFIWLSSLAIFFFITWRHFSGPNCQGYKNYSKICQI